MQPQYPGQGYPQGYPQQQGYPPQQHPPQYPPQQPAPQQGYPPQQYPPGQYGAPQGHYGAPQGYPPQQAPQQGYGAPPPSHYGAAPPMQYAQQPAPQQHFAGQPQYASAPAVMAGGPPMVVAGGAPVPLMAGVPTNVYYGPIIVTSMPGRPPRGRVVHPEWNPAMDAAKLRSAMRGLGTDNSDVIHIICNRDRDHLQYVRLEYRNQFGRHLVEDLKSETSFFFKDVITGLTMTDAEFRASILHTAMEGLGTRDSTLIDVICTATATQLAATKAAYSAMYHKDLVSQVKKETSGYYEKLLVELLNCTRPDYGVVQQTIAGDVETLWKATEGKIGTDEKTCIAIICSRSHEHMAAVDKAFVARSKKRNTLRKCLDSETSGNFKIALQAAMTDPIHWFAHRIHFAAKGVGTNDTMFLQCMLLPNQWQVQDIVTVLRTEHGKDLLQLIRSETSGNYKNALIAHIENCLRP